MKKTGDKAFWVVFPFIALFNIVRDEIEFWISIKHHVADRPLKKADFSSPLWWAKSKESQED